MVSTVKKYFPLGSFGCFYCGVDSTSILVFLIVFIGSLVLGTTFLGLSMMMKGRFKDSENIKYDVFKAENRN